MPGKYFGLYSGERDDIMYARRFPFSLLVRWILPDDVDVIADDVDDDDDGRMEWIFILIHKLML